MLCISVVNKLTLYTDTFLMVVLALPISCQIYIDLEVDIDQLLKFDSHTSIIWAARRENNVSLVLLFYFFSFF